MPQFDFSTAASQVFWLIVIFTTLYLALRYLVLPRMTEVIETRQKKIDDDLARAERLRSEAEGVFAEYEKALADARARAGDQMKAAADAAAATAAERIAAFNAELAVKTGEAESRIAAAEKTARENMKTIATEAAGLAVQKLLGSAVPAGDVEAAVDANLQGVTGARG